MLNQLSHIGWAPVFSLLLSVFPLSQKAVLCPFIHLLHVFTLQVFDMMDEWIITQLINCCVPNITLSVGIRWQMAPLRRLVPVVMDKTIDD